MNDEERPCLLCGIDKTTSTLQAAVYSRLRQFGKSFWIAKFGAWVHPYNKVRNCIALTLDGFVYYKFQVMIIKGRNKTGPLRWHLRFRVAELPTDLGSFTMDVKLNQRLSYEQLIEKISTATVG